MPIGSNTFTLIDSAGAEVFQTPGAGPAALPVTVRDPISGGNALLINGVGRAGVNLRGGVDANVAAVSATGQVSVLSAPVELPTYAGTFQFISTVGVDNVFKFFAPAGVTCNISAIVFNAENVAATANVFTIDRLTAAAAGVAQTIEALDPADAASAVTLNTAPSTYIVSDVMRRFVVAVASLAASEYGGLRASLSKPLRVAPSGRLGIQKLAGVVTNYSVYIEWTESS